MNRTFSRLALPVLALCMTGLGYYHVQQRSQSASPAPPPENPASAPFAHAVAGSGVVEPQTENIAIGAALPGLVLEVYVPSSKVGQRVHAGARLFRIDDRHLRAQLGVAEAQVAAARAAL